MLFVVYTHRYPISAISSFGVLFYRNLTLSNTAAVESTSEYLTIKWFTSSHYVVFELWFLYTIRISRCFKRETVHWNVRLCACTRWYCGLMPSSHAIQHQYICNNTVLTRSRLELIHTISGSSASLLLCPAQSRWINATALYTTIDITINSRTWHLIRTNGFLI